jgi:EmrB/QacA subfamily drug resistance transporter
MDHMDGTSKRVLMIIAALGAFLTPFMGSSINIALPTIGKEFGMNAVLMSWVATSYLLSSAIFLVPFGKLADIYGRKKIYIYGIITFTLASLSCAISFSATMLIVFRVLQGIGSAMIFGTGVAIVTSAFPPKERGMAIGVNTASVYLGLSGGPIIGGFLTHTLGWRSIFLINVPLGLAAVILTIWKLKGEWAEAKGERFDFYGSIMYGISLLTIIYGLTIVGEQYFMGMILICIGTIILGGFIMWEFKVEAPVLDMSLFRNNRVFAFSNLAAFINYSATFAVGFLLSLYLQYIKGFDAGTAGLVLSAQPLVMVVFSILSGSLSDKVESRKISSMGMFITSLALFVISLINDKTSIICVVVSLMLLGLGLALFSTPNTHAIMNSVKKRYYGVSSAAIGTMRLTGQMFSMAIANLIISIYIGKVEITPKNYLSFLTAERVTLLIFAGLCFAGTFASLARGKSKPANM